MTRSGDPSHPASAHPRPSVGSAAPEVAPLDPSRWRHLFPITRELVHFNHAGVSPVSTRVVEAMSEFLDLSARTGILHYGEMEARAERAREKFARLLLEEVVHSLDPSPVAEVEQELAELELLEYCRLALRRRPQTRP